LESLSLSLSLESARSERSRSLGILSTVVDRWGENTPVPVLTTHAEHHHTHPGLCCSEGAHTHTHTHPESQWNSLRMDPRTTRNHSEPLGTTQDPPGTNNSKERTQNVLLLWEHTPRSVRVYSTQNVVPVVWETHSRTTQSVRPHLCLSLGSTQKKKKKSTQDPAQNAPQECSR
jgi:hypothetical protein